MTSSIQPIPSMILFTLEALRAKIATAAAELRDLQMEEYLRNVSWHMPELILTNKVKCGNGVSLRSDDDRKHSC